MTSRPTLRLIAVIAVLPPLSPNCHAQQAATGASQAAVASLEAGLPKDVDPESGFRLPLLKREELDEQGQKRKCLLVGYSGQIHLPAESGIFLGLVGH
jgi:hypothetical protein